MAATFCWYWERRVLTCCSSELRCLSCSIFDARLGQKSTARRRMDFLGSCSLGHPQQRCCLLSQFSQQSLHIRQELQLAVFQAGHSKTTQSSSGGQFLGHEAEWNVAGTQSLPPTLPVASSIMKKDGESALPPRPNCLGACERLAFGLVHCCCYRLSAQAWSSPFSFATAAGPAESPSQSSTGTTFDLGAATSSFWDLSSRTPLLDSSGCNAEHAPSDHRCLPTT